MDHEHILAQLKDEFTTVIKKNEEGKELIEVYTPYLDNTKSDIVFYIEENNGKLLLTDGGRTTYEYNSSIIDFDYSNEFFKGYRCKYVGTEVVKLLDNKDTLARDIHSYIQCLIALYTLLDYKVRERNNKYDELD